MKFILFFILIAPYIFNYHSRACSMYKLTKNGQTMVGCNEDAWRTTPHIWFEIGQKDEYPACFTGSRPIGNNRFAAQSGMNSKGIVYTRLASYHPKIEAYYQEYPKIDHPDQFLMDVLHQSSSLQEVAAHFEKYDRSCYLEDVFVYVDREGNYLIVEPYHIIEGHDPSLIQANFCPTITEETDREKQLRYKDGKALVAKGFETDLNYCTKLSETMHVCRPKIGDGTLLTSIWDNKQMKVTLYFYHDYEEAITFDLQEEFAKGDHLLAVDAIFAQKPEFEALKSYITPFNTPGLRIGIALVGFFFFLSALFYFIGGFKKQAIQNQKALKVGISFLLVLATLYCLILATNQGIYYFPAPYESPMSFWVSLGAYLPYILTPAFFLLLFIFIRKKATKHWHWLSKTLILLNGIFLFSLFFGFLYWGLF